jgi:hypothetical protein
VGKQLALILNNPAPAPLQTPTPTHPHTVGPGGRLDVRAVTLYRGSGRKLDEGRLKLSVGSTVYVALGGAFTATGTLFREQDQTVTQVMEEMRHILDWRSRNFGGTLFVAGGSLYLNGCKCGKDAFCWRWIGFMKPMLYRMLLGRSDLEIVDQRLTHHQSHQSTNPPLGYFIRVRPLGSFIVNSAQVGRDLLVIAGNAVRV